MSVFKYETQLYYEDGQEISPRERIQTCLQCRQKSPTYFSCEECGGVTEDYNHCDECRCRCMEEEWVG